MKIFQKKWTKLLLTFVLCLALFASFAACSDPDGTPPTSPSPSPSTATDPTLVNNGYFVKVSGTTFPKTPTNWGGQAGNGTGGSAPYNQNEVLRGVVTAGNVKAADATLANLDPGKVNDDDEDSNLLMIYNKVSSAYRYKSSSIAVAKDAVVQISISVWTELESGYAKIAITDGDSSGSTPYHTIENIDTDGQWQTYTITIQGNPTATKYVYIELWLGEGGKDDDETHAKGVAYFDNITAYKNDDIENSGDYKYDDYDSWTTDADSQKFSIRLLNFDFTREYTRSGKKNYASDWTTLKSGSTTLDGKTVKRGIYGADESFTKADGTTTFQPGQEATSTDGKILGIENPFKTAVGYKSSAVFVDANAYYKLSVWVKTVDVDGEGVFIRLSDVDNTEFASVNTGDAWVQYNYYVKGSATQAKSLYLELHLGEGSSTSPANLTSGYAFFDSITYEEITETEFSNAEEDTHNLVVDELWSANLITTEPTFGDLEYVENHGAPNTPGVDQIVMSGLSTSDTLTQYGLTEAIGEIDRENADTSAFMLYHKEAGATYVALTDAANITILPNQNYRLSFWVRTYGIEDGSGVKIALVDATDSENLLDVATIQKVNTSCFHELEDGETCEECTDWQEVAFYVKGDANDEKKVSVKLYFGSGNAQDPSSYLTGHVFVNNFYLEGISDSEYTSSSSTGNIGKFSFYTSTASSTSVPNGGFDNFDKKDTQLVNGQLKGNPGAVTAWTLESNIKSNVVSGITNKDVFTYVGANDGAFPATTFPYDATLPAIYNGQPNLLMIWNKVDGITSYKSSDSSLAAESYYRYSVQVKTEALLKAGSVDNAFAFVTLSTPAVNYPIAVNTNSLADNGGWVTVEFYVSNGFAATNVSINLAIGTVGAPAGGVAYFDNVMMNTITEEEYNEATESTYVKVINLTSETFDTSSTSLPTTPTGYDGAFGKNSPSGSNGEGQNYNVSGVINLEDSESLEQYYTAAEMNALITHFGNSTADAHSAPYFVLIHNKLDTAFAYNRTSAISLSKGTTYVISFKAATMDLGQGDYAKVTVNMGGEDVISLRITAETWTEYKFYISTNSEKAASAKITFALGEGGDNTSDSSKWATGAFAFDDLDVEKLDAADLDILDDIPTLQLPDGTNIKYAIPEPETAPDNNDNSGNTTKAPTAGEVIEVIVAGLLAIAVLVVLGWALVKKFAPKIKAKKTKKFARPTKGGDKKKVVKKPTDDKFND